MDPSFPARLAEQAPMDQLHADKHTHDYYDYTISISRRNHPDD